jgi:hypothetical protein
MYGGFLGTDHQYLPEGETQLQERDLLRNETVLSGALRQPEIIPECEDAQGSCFQEHGTPGCDDPVCCTVVCSDHDNAFCCQEAWDANWRQ